jgi:hypothetical protein
VGLYKGSFQFSCSNSNYSHARCIESRQLSSNEYPSCPGNARKFYRTFNFFDVLPDAVTTIEVRVGLIPLAVYL